MADEEKPKRGRKRLIVIGLFVGVLAAEGVGVFVFVKSHFKAGSPAVAQASEGATTSQPAADAHAAGKDDKSAEHGDAHGGKSAAPTGHAGSGLDVSEGQPAIPMAEVKIGDFRAQNRRGQQSYVLNFTVFATVSEPDKPKLEEVVKAKDAMICDRFTRVVRSLEPERFAEPDLTTMRAQLKDSLGEVIGREIKVQELLLTEFVCKVE